MTLTLADLAVTYGKLVENHKIEEISLIILEMIAFIFDNIHFYINHMGDDFEALLNLLASLNLKSSCEVIAKAFKFQKEIYNLFWVQTAVQTKFQNPENVFAKINSFAENPTKLYFTNQNIFFQRNLNRLHPQKFGVFN